MNALIRQLMRKADAGLELSLRYLPVTGNLVVSLKRGAVVTAFSVPRDSLQQDADIVSLLLIPRYDWMK